MSKIQVDIKSSYNSSFIRSTDIGKQKLTKVQMFKGTNSKIDSTAKLNVINDNSLQIIIIKSINEAKTVEQLKSILINLIGII